MPPRPFQCLSSPYKSSTHSRRSVSAVASVGQESDWPSTPTPATPSVRSNLSLTIPSKVVRTRNRSCRCFAIFLTTVVANSLGRPTGPCRSPNRAAVPWAVRSRTSNGRCSMSPLSHRASTAGRSSERGSASSARPTSAGPNRTLTLRSEHPNESFNWPFSPLAHKDASSVKSSIATHHNVLPKRCSNRAASHFVVVPVVLPQPAQAGRAVALSQRTRCRRAPRTEPRPRSNSPVVPPVLHLPFSPCPSRCRYPNRPTLRSMTRDSNSITVQTPPHPGGGSEPARREEIPARPRGVQLAAPTMIAPAEAILAGDPQCQLPARAASLALASGIDGHQTCAWWARRVSRVTQ